MRHSSLNPSKIPKKELALDTSDGGPGPTTFYWTDGTLWLQSSFEEGKVYRCASVPGEYQAVYDKCIEVNGGSHKFVIDNEDELS